jgi:hypothetical protein
MNTNLLSDAASPEDASTGLRGVLAGFLTAIVLALRNYLKRKAAGKSELVTRAELCAEMREISERIHADHLALLEKLDSNHRELLAALERQAGRISALECGLARVDERTKE